MHFQVESLDVDTGGDSFRQSDYHEVEALLDLQEAYQVLEKSHGRATS